MKRLGISWPFGARDAIGEYPGFWRNRSNAFMKIRVLLCFPS